MLDDGWSAGEELHMLDGIAQCGLGNWAEVADRVRTKSSVQCEQHYVRCYAASPLAPLPSLPTAAERAAADAADEQAEASESPMAWPRKMGPEAAGFMPLRGDFSVEWFDDVEAVIRDLAVNDDDTPLERQLKLHVLDVYNARLGVRDERRRVVQQHGLFDLARLRAAECQAPPDERQIALEWQPLARFGSGEAHMKIIQGILLERRLCAHIARLQEYRRNGIRSLAAGRVYEAVRLRRAAAASSASATESVSRPRLPSLASLHALVSGNEDGGGGIGCEAERALTRALHGSVCLRASAQRAAVEIAPAGRRRSVSRASTARADATAIVDCRDHGPSNRRTPGAGRGLLSPAERRCARPRESSAEGTMRLAPCRARLCEGTPMTTWAS